MTAIVQLDRTTRRFGPHVAVLDADLTLGPGVYGLLGPNGAGKTTLMRMMAGLIRPTTGTITWLGGHKRRARELDNAIAICPDGEQLPPRETPLELLTLLLRLSGVSARDAGERAEAALIDLGLKEELDRPIAQLSRGQRQRVKLAQAFAIPAKLLLLDEPLNALDPVWRLKVSERIKATAGSGTCVIVSSHVLAEVEAVAERLILIFKGRIVAAGTHLEIRELLDERGAGLSITATEPRKLAAALMAHGAVTSTRVEDDILYVDADDMQTLCKALPPAVVASKTQVWEVRAQGDDLVSLFHALADEVR